MARDVVETICKMDNVNEKYFSILGKLFTNSKNEEEALDWIAMQLEVDAGGDSFSGKAQPVCKDDVGSADAEVETVIVTMGAGDIDRIAGKVAEMVKKGGRK